MARDSSGSAARLVLPLLAGLNPNNPRDQASFRSGICFHLLAGEAGDAALARIQRITVFPAVP